MFSDSKKSSGPTTSPELRRKRKKYEDARDAAEAAREAFDREKNGKTLWQQIWD